MPYSDPEEQRAYMRERYRDRYQKEKGFKAKESERKAAYYLKNRKYRAKVRAKALAAYHASK